MGAFFLHTRPTLTQERPKVPLTPGQLGNNVRHVPLSSKRVADIFA